MYEPLERRFCLYSELGFAFSPGEAGAYSMSDLERDSAGNLFVLKDRELLKYSPANSLLWSVPINTGYFRRLELDSDGNVYAAGDFNNTPLQVGGVTINNIGQNDAFIIKLNSAGQAQWGRAVGGNKFDQFKDLAVDNTGNVYAVGAFEEGMTFGSDTLTSAGGIDIYITKFSASGAPQWGRRFGGATTDRALRVDSDLDGNVYLLGEYIGPMTVTASISLPAYGPFSSGSARFVAKMTPEGDYAWATGPFAFDNSPDSIAMAVDPAGSIVVVGGYNSQSDFDMGPGETVLPTLGVTGDGSDTFAMKLSLAGELMWAKAIGGGSLQFVNGLAIGAGGNIHFVGKLQGGAADFDPSMKQYFLASNGTIDAFLGTLSSSGEFLGARSWGSTNRYDEALSITVDAQDRVYVAGIFDPTGTGVDFDPGPGTFSLGGGPLVRDFIMRLDPLSGSIETELWNDLDSDGLRDADELPLQGAVVELFSTSDATINNEDDGLRASVITDATGRLRVEGLQSGRYYLAVRTPQGMTIPPANIGSNEALDNDLLASGTTAVFVLNAGEQKTDQDVALTSALPKFGFAGQYANAAAAGNKVFTDAAGNVYLVGKPNGVADMDFGPAISNLIGFTNGVVLAKYTPSGALAWVRTLGALSSTDLAIDAAGDIYLLGHFAGNFDIDPDMLSTRTITSQSFSNDIFLMKLNSFGVPLWHKVFGSTGADQAGGMEFDATGKLIITGRFSGTVNFGFTPTDSATLTSTGNADAFALKVDLNGGVIWAKKWGGTGLDFVTDMKLDAQGNLLTVGGFNGIADFDPHPSQSFNLTSAGSTDVFLSKLNADGTFGWALRYGNTGNDDTVSLALDSAGNAITTGSFGNTINIGGTSLTSLNQTDGYVAKWSPTGNLQWLRQIGGAGIDMGLSLAVDTADSIYVAGVHGNNTTFGDGTTVVPVTSTANSNAFVEKFSSSGQYQALFDFTSTSSGRANSIVINPLNRRLHVVGEFVGTVDYDPGTGTYPLTSISPTFSSGFVAQLTPDSEQPQLALGGSTVTEQQSVQTVGPLTVVANTHETYTLRIASGPAGVFSVVTGNLVADSSLINFELTPSLQVDVEAIGSHGSRFQKQFTITVQDSNVRPVIAELADQTGAINVPLVVNGSFNDLDAGDSWTATVNYGAGGGVEPLTLTGQTFALDHTYAVGGFYTITVVVTDSGGLSDTQTFQAAINPLPLPVVSFTAANSTGVRGETLQFTAAAAGGILPTGTNSITWNFGDGSPALTFPIAAAWQNQTHVFTATGNYSVTVTLNAADGRSTAAQAALSISTANLRTDPGNPDFQTLVVGGSERPEVLRVVPGSTGQLKVWLGAELIGVFQDVEKVDLFGQAGDDLILAVASGVDFWIQGGDGNDVLIGGAGNDVLLGGAGNDFLWSAAGRDFVIGGSGADTLNTGADEDLLLAGDLALPNLAVGLADIQKEWTSVRPLAERIDNLQGDIVGPRDNGATLLLVNQSVFDDPQADLLLGDAANDWFFADDIEDSLPDLLLGDVLNLLG